MSTRPWIPPRRPVEAPSLTMVETTVPTPSEVPDLVPVGKFAKIAPLLMVIAVVGMIGIFFASGIRKINPMMGMFALMFVMSAVGMMGGHAGSGGKKTPEINAERRKYLEMLTRLRGTVHQRAANQYEFLAHSAPPPEVLASLPDSPRQWELSNPERDRTNLLAARVGLNDQRLGGGLTMAEAAPEADLEPVANVAAQRFFRAHRAVHGMPVKIDLKTHPAVQFFGDGDLAGVIRALLMQLAVFTPPNLLAIAVVSEHPEEWDWVKWLPHAQHPTRVDAVGSERMVYTPARARIGLADLLAGRGGFSADAVYSGDKPWLVVVADRVGALAGCGEGSEAVTVIRRGGLDESELAPTLGARVEVSADGRARRRRSSADDPLKYWVSQVDSMTAEQARRVARQLARWRSAGSGQADLRGDTGAGERTWQSLHNIDDPGSMGTSLWTGHRDRDPDRMNIPVGWDRSGAPVSVIMREDSEGGYGTNGLIVGTAGSGKSSFVADLMLGAVARHTPEELNAIYIDYKGDGTFPGFEKLNSTVQVLSNIGEADYINRLNDVLRGEVERRQRLRASTGRFKDAAAYLKARERGADLPPFPTLLVVVDEFTALLKDHPEFKDLFEHLGRQGRSDRIQLVLATQSLTGVSLGQLESNLHWRIALKTATAQDSIAAIGTKEAYHLTKIGQGYLKVGGGDPRFFEAAHVYEPYFPPAADSAPSRTVEAGGAMLSGIAEFGVEPVGESRSTVVEESPVEVEVPRSAEEVQNAPDLVSVVLDQLAGQGPPAYKMWLPRLTSPRPIGQLVEASGLFPAEQAVLSFPIGVLDRPYQHAQDVFSVDVSHSHLAVVGRARSGKSVALQSVCVSAALLNDPRKVQIYGIDYGADSKLLALEGLPHVSGVALGGNQDTVNRVLAEVAEVVRLRTEMFRELRIGSMDTYRQLVADGQAADDGLGDVLLVIDGWDEFRKNNPTDMDRIASLMHAGTAVGVHVVVSVLEWSAFPREISGMFNTIVELKIADPNVSKIDKRLAEAVPLIAGRGLDAATAKHIMIGAPRLDDVDAVDDAALAAAVAEIAARWTDEQARALRVLPSRVLPSQLPMPAEWAGSPWSVPVGLRERDLAPAVLDFMTERHLNVFGAKNSGKTHLLASIVEDLTRRFTPEQVRFMIVDLKGSRLQDIVDEDYLLRWTSTDPHTGAQTPRTGMVLTATDLAVAVQALANAMAARMPTGEVGREQRRDRSWWSGPEVFLIIDDYSMVNNAAPNAFAPLAALWGAAPSVGVHSVVACPIATANKVLLASGSLMKLNADVNSATLVMNGVKDNGPFIAGVRVTPRPPGRGVLVLSGEQDTIQSPVIPELEAG